MRAKRRERRALAEIEIELSRDDELRQLFHATRWPDDTPGRSHLESWLHNAIFQPYDALSALATSVALQLCIAAGCAFASSTGQVLLVALVLLAYPFTLTPLVAWSRLRPRSEGTW